LVLDVGFMRPLLVWRGYWIDEGYVMRIVEDHLYRDSYENLKKCIDALKDINAMAIGEIAAARDMRDVALQYINLFDAIDFENY